MASLMRRCAANSLRPVVERVICACQSAGGAGASVGRARAPLAGRVCTRPHPGKIDGEHVVEICLLRLAPKKIADAVIAVDVVADSDSHALSRRARQLSRVRGRSKHLHIKLAIVVGHHFLDRADQLRGRAYAGSQRADIECSHRARSRQGSSG